MNKRAKSPNLKGGKIMAKVLLVILAVLLAIGIAVGIVASVNEQNKVEMMEYIDTFVSQAVEPEYHPEKDEHGNWYFTPAEGDDFKVLHLTDIHLGGGIFNTETDKKTINAVAAMVKAEEPDLVIVTGDIAYAIAIGGTINNKHAHDMFTHLMETLGVYWTVAFGNHDTEPYNLHNRAAVADMYANESFKRCLFVHSPEGVAGEGNHVINIKDSEGKTIRSLFMIDSHSYVRQDLVGGLIDSLMWNYDAIKQSQVDWYEDMIELYNPENSFMFFHIPLREVKVGYDEFVANGREDTDNVKWHGGKDGEEGNVVVYASEVEDALFEKVEELGNTRAMFFGHDHFNNFVLEYKGVIFSYGHSVDYIAYGDIGAKGYQRGCTVITLGADGQFDESDIVHENYYQDKYVSLYEKETVDMYPYFDR